MQFNSIEFLIFLPAVFLLYWLLPHRFRWPLLLAASLVFYMSLNPVYVPLLLGTTLVSYFAALLLERCKTGSQKRLTVAAALVITLGVLFLFKYFNFTFGAISDLIGLFTERPRALTLSLVLPVGISFYTFQTIGYIIDVYRGDAPAEKHFGVYAVFVSFFPQLLAGPIARSKSLIPQLKQEKKFDEKTAGYGLKQMCWGFFKKLVIADRIAMFITNVFSGPENFTGFSLLLAAALFTVQIYCDFSGYSDIAIGTAKLMGIELMTNFRSPYFSGSLRDFWGRWHISLSTWFRDYVYIPLGGNRKGKFRQLLNILITFLLSGLWHGADWSFLVWGGGHGIGRVFEELVFPKTRQIKSTVLKAVRGILVFLFCAFMWIFFAAGSVKDSFYIIGHMFDGISSPVRYVTAGLDGLGFDLRNIVIIGVSLAILTVFDAFSLKNDVIEYISGRKRALRWIVYVLFAVFLILCIPAARGTEFIYFKF